jgi:hypothetical protein
MSTVDNPEEDTYNVGFDGIEFNDDELRKIKEKASPFTAGMNPTVLILYQPNIYEAKFVVHLVEYN